jgi:hypothetical protein
MQVAIIDSSAYTTKKIYSFPGEKLPHGALVEWEDSLWLITEVDAHDEVYASGKMTRCNYYLQWLTDSGEAIGRWCVVSDGTQSMTGEDNSDVMSIGDARVFVVVGKDEETSRLKRGKRFLIDDPDADTSLAFEITKTNKLYNLYNGRGVYRFVMSESNVTDNDNLELGIADYYKQSTKSESAAASSSGIEATQLIDNGSNTSGSTANSTSGRKVWL